MRPTTLAALSLALLAPSVARAADARVLAVFVIEDASKTHDAKTRREMTTYLSTRMAEGGAFRVVPMDDIRRALRAEKKKSYEACYDEACQIEIGREVAADASLLTRVIRAGDQCITTSTLYDLRSATTVAAATHKSTCSREGLVASIDAIATRLGAGAAAEPTGGESLDAAADPYGIGAEALAAYRDDPDRPSDQTLAAWIVARNTESEPLFIAELVTGGVAVVACLVGVVASDDRGGACVALAGIPLLGLIGLGVVDVLDVDAVEVRNPARLREDSDRAGQATRRRAPHLAAVWAF